jgi:hypothetical protein
MRDLTSSTYEVRRDALSRLATRARTQPLTAAEASAVLQLVRHDPDWRIKVRALPVLPLLREREEAVTALITALNDRDPNSSGGGNVPAYACSVARQMKDARTADALRNLLHDVEQEQPYPPPTRTLISKLAHEALASFSAANTQPG